MGSPQSRGVDAWFSRCCCIGAAWRSDISDILVAQPHQLALDVVGQPRKVPWVLAGKIFKLCQEANSNPPALSFGSWANALQAVLRSSGLYAKGPEIVEAIFKTFLPRAQEQLGITDDDAQKTVTKAMQGRQHGKRA